MQELAYRIRAAEMGDEPPLKSSIGATLSNPEGKGRRSGYRAAIQRGEVLVLEQHDRRTGQWVVSGFVDYHVRVDDTLTIKDAGSAGDAPRAAIVKHLLAELLRSAAPKAATVKLRVDAAEWTEILTSIPGFHLEGKEYRRPHYYAILEWSPELAAQATRRPDVRRGGRRVR